MKIAIIDDQKGEVNIMLFLARQCGFDPSKHEVKIVWQIDGVSQAVEQALEITPDAIFVDWQFDDAEYPIPQGITGALIVSALRSFGYMGPIYSHSSSGLKNFEAAGVAELMELESTNKKPEQFAAIIAKLQE